MTSTAEMDIEEITITATQLKEIPNNHISYQIRVVSRGESWSVWRRYSEFLGLHTCLKREFTSNPPPVAFPEKIYSIEQIFKNTLDPPSIEKRRDALEKYIQAIVYSSNTCWRKSSYFRNFLEIPETLRKEEADILPIQKWLDFYAEIEDELRELRSLLVRNSDSISLANSSNFFYKISEGLDRLDLSLVSYQSSNSTGISITELTRRYDLLYGLKLQKDQIQKRIQSFKKKSDTQVDPQSKKELLRISLSSSSRLPRRFGVPIEAEKTRELGNDALLLHQKNVMENQDKSLDVLGQIIKQQKMIGTTMNRELAYQNDILDQIQEDVIKVESNAKRVGKRMEKVMKG